MRKNQAPVACLIIFHRQTSLYSLLGYAKDPVLFMGIVADSTNCLKVHFEVIYRFCVHSFVQ